jgi:quercetin dioxygenase-like cupin family protein
MKALGVAALLVSIPVIGLAAQNPVPANEGPVPVEQEPHHHVVFKNSDVLVIHVILPPGERTLYHTHTRDRVSVTLTSTSIAQQELGKPEGPARPTHPGDVYAGALTGPYTHRLRNLGPNTFEVIDVEFYHRPAHPSPHVAGPVAAENPSARVYKWTLAPGASTPTHTHVRPYLIVAVTPMLLKMTAPGGASTTHEVKAGDFHWIDTKVTHSLTNAGAAPGQIVEIELK